MLPPDAKIGLVLSGGGAKGAYQAGVYQALSELGLTGQIAAYAGTSIGAFNALLFSCSGHPPSEIWRHLSFRHVFSLADPSSPLFSYAGQINDAFFAEDSGKVSRLQISTLLSSLRASGLGKALQELMLCFLLQYCNLDVLYTNDIPVFACAYDIDASCPVYFYLNREPKDLIPSMILASAAIPHVFPPVEVEGRLYADGGINDPLYATANTDKCPAVALSCLSLTHLIVVYLSEYDQADLSMFQDMPVLEIHPSQPLEYARGTGSFNMSQSVLQHRIELGYADGMASLRSWLQSV